MALLGSIIAWLIGGWLLLVMGLVVLRMIGGSISLTGLLKLEARAPFGFDRIQLVFVTLFFAGGYLVAALARGPGDNLPDIPAPLLLILLGSHGAYLGVKYTALRARMGRER
ncbi:MAG: hypothetical protein E6G94_04830 [Alphaproteobacteria bacterium]|nr:MAG: hypothetical protein E6G94_04830 [Alphaproteobacteria bacterium]